jgi:hypothetical protein
MWGEALTFVRKWPTILWVVAALLVESAISHKYVKFNETLWGASNRVAASVVSPLSSEMGEPFAIVGTGGCAESLYYGPQGADVGGSADGIHRTFLSTNIASKDVASTQWVQIVTVDGTQELFRIYWKFRTAKTYTQRIADAVREGETVTYLIVDSGTGPTVQYSGVWRYSSNSGITARTFDVPSTICCFSRDGGAWGAGHGVVDGIDGRSVRDIDFWGIGNFRGADSSNCQIVYAAGQGYTFEGYAPITYMYQVTASGPSAVPTAAPSARPTLPVPTTQPSLPPPTASPTVQPSQLPTYPAPTPQPSFSPQPTIAGQQMFASIGGTSCARTLFYGPQAVSTQGSADGRHESFVSTSTTYKDVPHTEWLQIVTSEGATELFRIYWTFDTARSLEGHFAAGSSTGAAVAYRVVDSNGATLEDARTIWRFTTLAFSAADKFAAESTSCCFCSSAVWGLGRTTADGTAAPAWGQANTGDTDANLCHTVYQNGEVVPTARQGRSHFYYAPDASLLNPGGGAQYALVRFTVTLVNSVHSLSLIMYVLKYLLLLSVCR